ncbi:MAG: hypothetical protein FJX76_00430 [Armatimonadetes bacterium]|nr:hypothetical protein [Armatimonadota bacterium]
MRRNPRGAGMLDPAALNVPGAVVRVVALSRHAASLGRADSHHPGNRPSGNRIVEKALQHVRAAVHGGEMFPPRHRAPRSRRADRRSR